MEGGELPEYDVETPAAINPSSFLPERKPFVPRSTMKADMPLWPFGLAICNPAKGPASIGPD